MMRRALGLIAAVCSISVPATAQEMLCTGGEPSSNLSPIQDFKIAAQCELEAASDGTILVIASTSLDRVNSGYTVRLTVGLDQPTGPGLVTSERVLDIYETNYLDRQNSMTTVAMPTTAGSHTLYYLAERVVGDGTIGIYRPRIAAIFIPSSSTNIRLCEGRAIGEWATTSATASVVASCTLGGLGMGAALVAADGWMRLSDSGAELRSTIALGPSSPPEPGTIRMLDVVPDLVYDGSDTGLASSFLTALGPGSTSFYLTARRSDGSGTVSLNQTGIAALWAATGGPVLANGSALATEWSTTALTPEVILQTDLNPPVDGYFLIVATAVVSPDAADYGAHFMARIDSGDDIANRYVRINDNVDRNLALTDLVPVEAGNHTIKLQGYRSDTPAGTRLRVRDGSLSVLFFPAEMVAIFGDNFESGWDRRWSLSVP